MKTTMKQLTYKIISVWLAMALILTSMPYLSASADTAPTKGMGVVNTLYKPSSSRTRNDYRVTFYRGIWDLSDPANPVLTGTEQFDMTSELRAGSGQYITPIISGDHSGCGTFELDNLWYLRAG